MQILQKNSERARRQTKRPWRAGRAAGYRAKTGRNYTTHPQQKKSNR